MYGSLISELLLSWARPFFTHALYNTDVNIDFHFAISDEHVFFVCILQTEVLTHAKYTKFDLENHYYALPDA